MYGLLIQEIARARHEERLCGIPGPKFRVRVRQFPASASIRSMDRPADSGSDLNPNRA